MSLQGTSFCAIFQESDRERLTLCMEEMLRAQTRSTSLHVRLEGDHARSVQLFIAHCKDESNSTYYVIGMRKERDELKHAVAHTQYDRNSDEDGQSWVRALSSGSTGSVSSSSSAGIPITSSERSGGCEATAWLDASTGDVISCSAGCIFVSDSSLEQANFLDWVLCGKEGVTLALQHAAKALADGHDLEKECLGVNVGPVLLQTPHFAHAVFEAQCTVHLPSISRPAPLDAPLAARIDMDNLTQHQIESFRLRAFAFGRMCV